MNKLEPTGGCMYRPHMLMVTSGEFWRCAHGKTSLYTCYACMICHPIDAYKWFFPMSKWSEDDND